jgi:hypothetical protein
MAGKTRLFTVTDAVAVAVVAIGYTALITVQEDPSVASWPTQNFYVYKPSTSSDGIQRPIGGSYGFTKSGVGSVYSPGEIAGYVKLVNTSTSTTFQQDEA